MLGVCPARILGLCEESMARRAVMAGLWIGATALGCSPDGLADSKPGASPDPVASDESGDADGADEGGDGADGGDGSGDGGEGGDGGDGGDGSDDDACPDGVICVDEFPFTEVNDTRDSSLREFDSYSCAPDTDESGPELVYRVDLDEDGYLAVALDDWDEDVDVHILGSLDADDCLDRGHYDAGVLLPAGRYYVVVDSWTDDGQEYAGQYEVFMGHTASADFEDVGLDRDILALGLEVFDAAWMRGDIERFEYTIIDFSLPSTDKRQWTLDLVDGSLLWNLHVTHGEGSGSDSDIRYADRFSNIEDSHQSSLGAMVTAEAYSGGLSMRLDGLEPGFNDAVRSRYIVVHGASYATQEFIDTYGYLGRSWGCPAVDDAVVEDFINDVSDGTLYWTYYPDDAYLEQSAYLP